MKMLFTTLIFLIPSLVNAFWGFDSFSNYMELAKDPEVSMYMEGIVKRWGYSVEQHTVVTEDKYRLKIFRMFQIKNVTELLDEPRPVVLLQHGFMGNSIMWVMNLPHQSLAFLLAEAGFDVWLGNSRGNMYGNGHETLMEKENYKAYWNFSWTDMAKYDVPSTVNFILNKTGASSLFYVGHGVGALTAIVKLSEDHEFAKKVRKIYALAPILQMKNIQGNMRRLLDGVNMLYPEDQYRFATGKLHPSWINDISSQFGKRICKFDVFAKLLCNNMLFSVSGPDTFQMNTTRLPVYHAHTPDETSAKLLLHLAQMQKAGKLQGFDYGKAGNLVQYGKDTPSEFNLTSLDTPMTIYWGGVDYLATKADLSEMLPKLENTGSVYFPDYNHLDFIWGLRAACEIYRPIIEDIKIIWNL